MFRAPADGVMTMQNCLAGVEGKFFSAKWHPPFQPCSLAVAVYAAELVRVCGLRVLLPRVAPGFGVVPKQKSAW